MGRRAKPAEVAEKQGNPGHRKIVATPTSVPRLGVEAPHWLKADARKVWAELVALVSPLGFIKQTDAVLLSRYADHFARYIRLSAEVSKGDGVTYMTDTPHGKMNRLHPNFNALMRTEAALQSIEDRIGMSPSARQTLMTRAAAGLGAPTPAPGQGATDPRKANVEDAGPFGALALDLDAEDADETGLPQ